MKSSLNSFLHSRRKLIVIASTTSALAIGFISRIDTSASLHGRSKSDHDGFNVSPCACDSTQDPPSLRWQQQKEEKSITVSARPELYAGVHSSSFWKRLLAPIGILSLPRPLTSNDPAFKVSKRFLQKRQIDEEKMRKLVTEDVPKLAGNPNFEEEIALLRQDIFRLAYGKGVTAQVREDFLIRYGCTGFNDVILCRLVELCTARGLVEIGAGHGQWQKALTDAYIAAHEKIGKREKFDFVLAYDNNASLPLNTHIYNQYTRPHHDYFGSVQKIDSTADLGRILRSWACRGRALLMVYPPPGSMAKETLEIYLEASPDNDTLIYVGEGRGGANGDEAFFDLLENGGWILIDILEVFRPPGDKGYEKLYILHRITKDV